MRESFRTGSFRSVYAPALSFWLVAISRPLIRPISPAKAVEIEKIARPHNMIKISPNLLFSINIVFVNILVHFGEEVIV